METELFSLELFTRLERLKLPQVSPGFPFFSPYNSQIARILGTKSLLEKGS